ncbi:hypothetical protein HAX54_043134 [Datura stramonium]|uniref:Uncharacterized protein n=1 Tax=Datura stramonium TaxID=4076 RepID=A0ABS8W446_DATST|nr:hypothetical protein [Datura stramonium]
MSKAKATKNSTISNINLSSNRGFGGCFGWFAGGEKREDARVREDMEVRHSCGLERRIWFGKEKIGTAEGAVTIGKKREPRGNWVFSGKRAAG